MAIPIVYKYFSFNINTKTKTYNNFEVSRYTFIQWWNLDILMRDTYKLYNLNFKL